MILFFARLLLISNLSLFYSQQTPIFSSGGQNLEQFLGANMIYPWYAKQNCIQGIIKVSFQLNKKGELINEKVKDGLGIDLDSEALRLIKLTSYKWEIPKGYKENTEIIVPIKFSLKNYNCERLSNREVKKAIVLYQTRQALENVVTSFYKNKIVGNANTKNEGQIIQLKADLGFDEEFVTEQVAVANEMLKQGDKSGACEILNLIKNLGFADADDLIAQNCK